MLVRLLNDKAYKRGECNAAVVEEGEDALLIMPMLQIAGFYVMNNMKNEFSFELVNLILYQDCKIH